MDFSKVLQDKSLLQFNTNSDLNTAPKSNENKKYSPNNFIQVQTNDISVEKFSNSTFSKNKNKNNNQEKS